MRCSSAYAGCWIEMPTTLVWLPTVTRIAIAPVLIGALVLLVDPSRSASDLPAAAVGVVLTTLAAAAPLACRGSWSTQSNLWLLLRHLGPTTPYWYRLSS